MEIHNVIWVLFMAVVMQSDTAAGLPIRVMACVTSEPFATTKSFAKLTSRFRELANPSEVRGTVRIVNTDWSSLFVAYHPLHWRVNTFAWRRMDVDFGVVDPSLLSNVIHVNDISAFISDSPYVIAANLENTAFYYAYFIQRYSVKTVDNVTLGFIPIWGDQNKVATVSFDLSIPPVINILRNIVKVDMVIGICLFSKAYFSAKLSLYDMDVLVLPDGEVGPPRVENGTWLLSKKYEVEAKGMFTIIDLEHTSSGWTYSSRSESFLDPLPEPLNAHQTADQNWYETELIKSENNNPIVGKTAETLDMSDYACMEGECEAGNLITDAMMYYKQTSDVVIINGGGIFYFTKAGWDIGILRKTNVTDLFPFSNTICTYTANATGLWLLAEHGVSALDSSGNVNSSSSLRGSLLQSSGLRLQVDAQRPPNNRVVSMEIYNKKLGEWEPVSRTKMYTVTSTSYLCADRGDGYKDWWVPGTLQNFPENVHALTSAYLTKNDPYTPLIDGRLVKTLGQGTPLGLVRLSAVDCNTTQRFEATFEYCIPCPPGTWHPEQGTGPCVSAPSSSSVKWYLLVFPLLGAAIIIAGGIYWILTAKQRKINKLYTAHKIAEDCANAIAGMRLNELDYLFKLKKPTAIQASFIAIISTLKSYRDFMPQSLLDEAGRSEQESENTLQASEISGKDRPWLTLGLRSKHATMMVANIVEFRKVVGKGTIHEAEFLHRQFLSAVMCSVGRGVCEPFVGDKVLITWNVSNNIGSHKEHGCRAALNLTEAKTPLKMNVGVASGEVICGNTGIEGMKKFGVLGSSVIESFYLQQLNAVYDTSILINAALSRAAKWKLCFQDRLKHLKYDKDIELWELLGERIVEEAEWMYQLATLESDDPLRDLNLAWMALLSGDHNKAKNLAASDKIPMMPSRTRLLSALANKEDYFGPNPLLME